MDTHLVKVGMREFREHLPQYLLSSSPVAITRHGETMGFYIPAHHAPKQAELNALKQAALALETLLAKHQVSEEDLMAEFRVLRKGKKS
jgi:hypothetical protein